MKNFKKALAILLMLPIVALFFVGVYAWWLIMPDYFKSVLTDILILATLVVMFGTGAQWLNDLNKEK